ncbi:YqgQ family protein [Savagea sp. SN6]|uniref:YqgQ family protein n=2 Tax=Savagea serpentis TaxID=2785297 RepID=A0A8J7G4K0_9BACL|nr:YqgQ family protein [Savagea serpentis]
MYIKHELNEMYDVQQLLKQFNIFVYFGDQEADCILMQSELKDLFDSGMLEREDYIRAAAIVRQRLNLIKQEK